MSSKRFRIAFSFAGEKRAFVAEIAAILAARFGEEQILYDKYHEAEFARRNLGIYLPELYHNQSDLVVVIACADYDSKQWTGLEWAAIHDLLSKRRDEEVMLRRFNLANLTGLYSTAGFIELDQKTPEQAAMLILERIAINEGRSKDYYTNIAKPIAKRPSTSISNKTEGHLGRLLQFPASKNSNPFSKGAAKSRGSDVDGKTQARSRVTASTGSVALVIQGPNQGNISIKVPARKSSSPRYPANSIGADANLTNYVEYLCHLYVQYMTPREPDENISWAKIGKQIKTKFRLIKRTRNHLSVERFPDLVHFLVNEKLAKTPVGKKHLRAGHRLCRTFEEFRDGDM